MMHLLLSTLFLGAACIGIQADVTQIPLQLEPYSSHISWNFSEKQSPDSKSHIIFDNVNSFLQHWTNTRYRNGHSIVPGTIPIGTLLYHGAAKEEIPSSPDWTAIDPEHSYIFCFHGQTEDSTKCWHLTLITTRPLKVLYFDGSSAAKFPGGSLDSQDVLLWGEVKPEWTYDEQKRIDSLCEWGKQYGIDGFVRMEMSFEVMLCDFSAGVEVVSFHRLAPRRNAHVNISEPLKSPLVFGTIEAGSWHNYFPGETRIHLNYAGVLSFYDTALFPSLKALHNKERWAHRLEGISSEDVDTLLKTLGSILDGAWDRPVSGIDWKTILRIVVDRYAVRLQNLNRLLNSTVPESEADPTLALKKVYNHLSTMLSPYRLYSASPPEIHSSIPKYSWAIPVFEECSTTHTRYIDSNPSLSQKLTYSEHLLLNSTKSVSKEICRVIVGMWAEGTEHSISKEGFTRSESAQELITRWKGLIEDLMAWLDWSEWVTCRPACGDEEMCYLPTWPFFTDGSGIPQGLSPPGRYHHFDRTLRPNSDGVDDWVKPQPMCIQRVEFHIVVST